MNGQVELKPSLLGAEKVQEQPIESGLLNKILMHIESLNKVTSKRLCELLKKIQELF